MANPLVSIIIPTYNRQLLLMDAVESCLGQSWKNIEIIIVDDGSADGTEDFVANKLASEWPAGRVKYEKQVNAGASSARNRGLKLSCGEYIQFLDSDDVLDAFKIERQLDILLSHENRDAACCNCYGRMGEISSDFSINTTFRIGCPETDPVLLIRQLSTRIVHGMQTSAPLWRRSHLIKHAGWRVDIGLGDDLEYHIRLLSDAESLCFVSADLFFVREHLGSRLSSDKITEASLASLIRTRRSIFQVLTKLDLWDFQIQQAFLDAMRTIYANALKVGNQSTVIELEEWLWHLSTFPGKLRSVQIMIFMRRIFGNRMLLENHKLFAKAKVLIKGTKIK